MVTETGRRLAALALATIPAIVAQGTPIACYGKIDLSELEQEKCLAVMVYGEARGESKEGKVAVAYTAMNRAAKKSLCQVVLAPKQYSIFNNNPALRAAALSLHVEPIQKNEIDQKSWQKSVEVAAAVMRKQLPDPTKGATHYLAPKLMAKLGYKYPRWSKEYKMVAMIDNHRFYKPVDRPVVVALK